MRKRAQGGGRKLIYVGLYCRTERKIEALNLALCIFSGLHTRGLVVYAKQLIRKKNLLIGDFHCKGENTLKVYVCVSLSVSNMIHTSVFMCVCMRAGKCICKCVCVCVCSWVLLLL